MKFGTGDVQVNL